MTTAEQENEILKTLPLNHERVKNIQNQTDLKDEVCFWLYSVWPAGGAAFKI